MQDNWQEFDRQMKSVLHDAGEKVPGRVWRAVSSRLDSAASAALWWRWAVPAFVAAALVAGLFLSGTFKPANNTAGNIDILAAADVTESDDILSGDALALAEIAEEIPEVKAPAVRPVRRHSATTETVTAETHAAEEIRTEASEESAPDVAVTDDGDKKDTAFDEETAAHWARIEQEERRIQRAEIKVSGLYAQGSMGGNDSNITYRGNGISLMAPGQGSENAGISEAGQSTYGVPFTIGAGVRFHVLDKLSFGTGLDYSLLTRTFNGSYSGSAAAAYEGPIYHSLQYIGVPVNVYYDILKSRDDLFTLYAWGGGEAEYCIANHYRLQNAGNALVKDAAGGFQFSAALGLGLEFRLTDKLGLYADPSVRYYFHGSQPKSVRTDKPLMFTFDAGLRFNF